jgi:hypothetical protein
LDFTRTGRENGAIALEKGVSEEKEAKYAQKTVLAGTIFCAWLKVPSNAS